MLRSFTQNHSFFETLSGPVLVVVLLFTTGCWDEVSYDAPSAETPSPEALASAKPEEPIEESAIEAPALSDPEEITPPVEADRYSDLETPAEEAPEELLPWETASRADDTSPEAERLFGGTDEPQEKIDSPVVVEEEVVEGELVDEESDGFEAFLEEAYADLIDEPTEEMPEETLVEEVTTPEPVKTIDSVADLPVPEPVAKEPTIVPEAIPEETDLPDFLLDDEPDAAEPAPPEADSLPSSRYDKEPLFPAESIVTEPITEPMTEPEPTLPPQPTIETLPEVPVLTYNTRHLAWLLGGKLSLAQLAGGEGGATPDEVAEWTEETRRLAEQLKVAVPSTADPKASAVERIGRLLGSAAEIGNTLSKVHGADHAALVEMALKTNALLVLHEGRPDLTPAVARAVAAAANRADLPGYVWRDSIKVLERQPTVDEVYDAVIKLHTDVEAYLR